MVPFYAVNIRINNGNIQALEFDNLCQNCGRSEFVKSQQSINRYMRAEGSIRHDSCMCGIPRRELNMDKAMDMRLFVTWEGTDAKGRRAESGNYKFSNFAGPTLRGMYEWTKDEY